MLNSWVCLYEVLRSAGYVKRSLNLVVVDVYIASLVHKFHCCIIRKNLNICSFFVQRSNNDNFSAQVRHLISTKPCACCLFGSNTKPSGNTLI